MSASLDYTDFALRAIRSKTNRFDIVVSVRDADGLLQPAASLAGWKLWFTAKTHVSDADANAVFFFNTVDHPGVLDITDAANRKARLTLAVSAFAALTFGRYLLFCDVQGKSPGGDVVTLCRGMLELVPELTQASA